MADNTPKTDTGPDTSQQELFDLIVFQDFLFGSLGEIFDDMTEDMDQ